MASNSEAVRAQVDRAYRFWTDGDIDAALACCRRALRIDPQNVDALAHTGTIFWVRGDRDEAERLYRRAHALAPRHVGVLVNLATLHHDAGELDTSLAWLDRASAIQPRSPELTWRRALIELAKGDYAAGWAHYEAGLFQPSLRGTGPGFVTPPWDGAPCDRLVIWHEQGFGDTLHFLRYARLCKARARRVVVLCPAELVALVRSAPFVDDAVDTIGADDFDAHASILSLPAVFGTTLDTVPADIPYLFADPARVAYWAARLQQAAPDARPKVGLVWAGNFRHAQPQHRIADRARSVSLATMRPLLQVPGIAFVSLQKGEAMGQTAGQAAGVEVVDWMDEVADFADTAALVANLDLVISVDTSVVHVAGALGKPSGCCRGSTPAGAGCRTGPTVPGIRPRGSSDRPERVNGTT